MVVAVVTTHAVSAGLTVTGVTCGGVAMTAGPVRGGSGVEQLWQVWWLAGASLPTGNQAVVATLSSAATRPGLFAFNLADADGGDLALINPVTPADSTITLTRTVTVSKTAAQSAFALMRQSSESAVGTAVAPAALMFEEGWFPAVTTNRLGAYERTDAASGSVGVQATWGSTASYGSHIGFAVSTTFGLDSTPPDLTGALTVGTVTSSSIQITWPTATDAVGVTAYETSLDGTTWTSRGLVLTYTFTGLTASTSYTPRVRARDEAGNISAVLSVTQSTSAPSGDTTPPVLTGTIAFSSVGQTGFTADWSPATDNVGIVGYDYSLDAGTTWTPVLTDAVTVAGLTPGTAYAVRVRAVDAAGNLSTPVLSGSVTTLAAGATITVQDVKNGDGTLLANTTIPHVVVIERSTRTAVVALANQVTTAGADLVLTHASLLGGTGYMVLGYSADGSESGSWPATAV